MTCYFQDLFKTSIHDTLTLYKDNHEAYTLLHLKNAIGAIANTIEKKQAKQVSADRWLIATDNHFWFTASLFALLYLGKTPVILGHKQPIRINEQQAEFDAILGTNELKLDAKLDLKDKGFITLPLYASNIDNQNNLIIDESINFFETLSNRPFNHIPIHFFTSGSSGAPQKIRKTFSILAKESTLIFESFQSSIKNSHFVTTVSPLHQYGITFAILLPLRMKRSSNLLAITYQEELNRGDEKSICFITSPAFLKRLDLTLTPNCKVSAIFSAGGPLSSSDIYNTYQIFLTTPIEIYGSSETCVIAYQKFNPQYFQKTTYSTNKTPFHAIFQPFPGITINKTNDGLINIKSPLISEESMTLQDKIELHEKGFSIIGRSDKIIKIEEKRISLNEIAQRIERIIPESQVFITPLIQGKRVILGAIIVTQNYQEMSKTGPKIIRNALKEQVESVAIPRKWHFISHIPMNQQGKITQQSLKALFDES